MAPRIVATGKEVVISPPNFREAKFHIIGNGPLVLNKFANKIEQEMLDKHIAGPQSKSRKVHAKKNVDELYEGARHISTEGWDGIPITAFQNGMVSACRTVGFKMTHAKMGISVVPDGYEADGTALVRIKGKPVMHTAHVRNANGSPDIRIRPMFKNWSAELRVRYDADMFSEDDIANLVMRVGMQVGIGEGRPDSKNSAGMGWGTFIFDK